MERRGLRARDDVADIDERPRIGDADRRDQCAEAGENLRGRTDRRGHLGVDPVEVMVLRNAHPQPGDRALEHAQVVRNAAAARRRVARVVPRHDLEDQRRVGDRSRQRTQVVHRPRQRHRPGAAHATVRRLETGDAATRGRQPDGAAGVAAERRERESGGHRGGRAAARAPGAVAGLPRVVPERAHRQLRHVQLAQGDGAGFAQPRHRGAFDRRGEVFASLRAARGRQAWHVAEVLVRERHAVQRAATSTGRELGFEGSRRRQGPVGVDRDERMDTPVESRDTIETGLCRLDGRDLARGDRARQGLDRPASHAVSVGLSPSSASTKPAGSSAIARSAATRSTAAASPATSALTRLSGAFMDRQTRCQRIIAPSHARRPNGGGGGLSKLTRPPPGCRNASRVAWSASRLIGSVRPPY